jgi:hypothetical protein
VIKNLENDQQRAKLLADLKSCATPPTIATHRRTRRARPDRRRPRLRKQFSGDDSPSPLVREFDLAQDELTALMVPATSGCRSSSALRSDPAVWSLLAAA